jgi:hypothetical protein
LLCCYNSSVILPETVFGPHLGLRARPFS